MYTARPRGVAEANGIGPVFEPHGMAVVGQLDPLYEEARLPPAPRAHLQVREGLCTKRGLPPLPWTQHVACYPPLVRAKRGAKAQNHSLERRQTSNPPGNLQVESKPRTAGWRRVKATNSAPENNNKGDICWFELAPKQTDKGVGVLQLGLRPRQQHLAAVAASDIAVILA